ncbi:unnamed protein product [marine sediment metagenome]|uniref:Uncharacterized protein n=1 Tax=marine sediment metagenome TaxID=412755 RepID=X1S1L5_9ZZZZ
MRGVAVVDVLVDIYNRFTKDVANATHQPHPIGKFDVANVAVGKERRQGIIPQPDLDQRFSPGDLYLVVIDKGLETVKGLILAIVSSIKHVQMDV